MIGIADKVLRDCERFIAAGNIDDARKCANGLSILTDQPAWKKAYDFLIDRGNCEPLVTRTSVKIPKNWAKQLHEYHDSEGIQIPNQSVRGGTQVNLTKTPYSQWIESLVGEKIIGLWTTRIQKGGSHIPHLHPRGQNSHVLYIEVPDDKSGLLYFGTPRYAKIPPQLVINPKEGMMVSFPCWLWHGVTEYKNDKPRLTLAFDTESKIA